MTKELSDAMKLVWGDKVCAALVAEPKLQKLLMSQGQYNLLVLQLKCKRRD